MKKFKIIALTLVFALAMQFVACAAPAPASSDTPVIAASVQPRGRYLLGGGCSIAPGAGYVIVEGHTEAYSDVDTLIIELTILKEVANGIYVEVWSDSLTGTDDFEVTYPSKRVYVDSGYDYMVEATHTVTHNGVTETNTSEAGDAYVYY